MATQLKTTPSSSAISPLVLCADGGGSKVCVVIRSSDGLEVRGTAGPCNVQSVGHFPAIQAILLATYRALSLLPPSHLPPNFTLPSSLSAPSPSTPKLHSHPLSNLTLPISPYASRPNSPSPTRASPLPPLSTPLFQYAWLALAGISTLADGNGFLPHVMRGLCISEDRVKITNGGLPVSSPSHIPVQAFKPEHGRRQALAARVGIDLFSPDVNLLAAPAFDLPGIEHVVAVVCGTGTVGRTIRVGLAAAEPSDEMQGKVQKLPLQDVAVSRGWGYMLCDEGSAFWLGRLAIRSLLYHADRLSSSPIHSPEPPRLLPLHRDLLAYFATSDPMDLIELVSLTGPFVDGLSIGEAVAKRNAAVAGAARVVLTWAFPDDAEPPTPPDSPDKESGLDLAGLSRDTALRLAKASVAPLIELTMSLLGDQSVVTPEKTVLALGGGLMMSKGYRGLLEAGLRSEGVSFGEEVVVGDAAGVGARGLARVEFGI
ncbi:MAG: hypothetical protein TREMPRED_003535 [Tremellales sp. Tagirdzhanova-0007]|nr:MAG: hypothetical protein TREMPRED_003535 [Tremellales sp. Tagirdzhanova-0007]